MTNLTQLQSVKMFSVLCANAFTFKMFKLLKSLKVLKSLNILNVNAFAHKKVKFSPLQALEALRVVRG
jgi:hypothetical protein